MAARFSGKVDELKSKLAPLETDGSWTEVNANQHQFRHNNGGVLNWFPSTGSINFQGQPAGRDALEAEVRELLQQATTTVKQQTGIARIIATPPIPETLPRAAGLECEGAEKKPHFLRDFADSELVLGLVGAIGTDMDEVIKVLEDRLAVAGYSSHRIQVSKDVIPKLVSIDVKDLNWAAKINSLMDAGNAARAKDSGILASGVAAEIASKRINNKTLARTAFIISSLKHPDEVLRLRQIYPRGFYLIGVHPDENVRWTFLQGKGVKDHRQSRWLESRSGSKPPDLSRLKPSFSV